MFLNIADIKHTKTAEKGKYHPLESNTLQFANAVGFQYVKTYKYVSNIMQGMSREGGDVKKPISRHEVIINGQYNKYEPLFLFQKPFSS